jgi:hypothetical protein
VTTKFQIKKVDVKKGHSSQKSNKQIKIGQAENKEESAEVVEQNKNKNY